ncbi:MAG: helix-turn-helix domain-containing protein [Gammaproteobacteria bacterium]|nr:helix-turn-helix domain-containing protein [Gammaproteobacteria bacterium]OED44083.1 MerR family transcriptional regulator [Chromatiales bacterium (ex Bugula neritina AB1)]
MFSIGELSKKTQVKVPTIRYYEEIGILPPAERTEGNQRRYNAVGLERLSFIKHARELGFSIDAITSLIELQEHPDRSCCEATDIATAQLSDVRIKIKKLKLLEKELARISTGCDGKNISADCYVLKSLADHKLCKQEH